MKSASSRSRITRCDSGAALIQFTLVFPVLIAVALGAVDIVMYMFNWNLAAKATQRGARVAVVTAPIASGITDMYTGDGTKLGLPCYDSNGNQTVALCGSIRSSTCQPAATGGSCTDSYTFSDTAFLPVYNAMQDIFPQLRREDVEISYAATGLGFVGRPGGVPMTVTVGLRAPNATARMSCKTHQFYFIAALMRWTMAAPQAPCPTGPAGARIPTFATSLPSEDMATN